MGKEKTEFFRAQTISGRGSGEQQVRKLFPNELAAIRKRPKHENHWLVVMTDGDGLTLKERRVQLYQEITSKAMETFNHDEKCMIFIPCRNLESWFAWIETDNSDEKSDYKNKYRHAKPTKFGKMLFDKYQRSDYHHCPESLKDAYQEWQKMKRLQ